MATESEMLRLSVVCSFTRAMAVEELNVPLNGSFEPGGEGLSVREADMCTQTAHGAAVPKG